MADLKINLTSIKVDKKLIRCDFHLDGEDVIVTAKSYIEHLPAELGNINNTTDIREDYVEEDWVRVEKDNPFYEKCYRSAVYCEIQGLNKQITRLHKLIRNTYSQYQKERYQKHLDEAYASKDEYTKIFQQISTGK